MLAVMESQLRDTDLKILCTLLEDYRAAFDRLHFLLEVQIHLLTSGRDDQLHHVVDLLADTNARLSRLDLEREIVLGNGSDGQPRRLAALVEMVDEPWKTMLGEHHQAMERLVTKTSELIGTANAVIRRMQADLPDVVSLLGGSPSGGSFAAPGTLTYGRSGRGETTGLDAYLFEDRI